VSIAQPVALSPTQRAHELLMRPLVGRETPGGCESCDAYQTVRPGVPGVWHLTVHHDDDCPALRQHQGRP
jgi:hypothetical protein